MKDRIVERHDNSTLFEEGVVTATDMTVVTGNILIRAKSIA